MKSKAELFLILARNASRLTLAALSLCILIGAAKADQSQVRLQDSSDWWSFIKHEEDPYIQPNPPLKVQNKEPNETNFQISGVELSTGRDFSEIRSKFGEATEIDRGDAASSRHQVCYVSPSGDAYLIFEFGEIDSVLYLFEGGSEWKGMEFCTKSSEVSSNISTVSGLKLGMGPRKVKDILGDPSINLSDKLTYYFSYKKKSDPETLVRIRKSFPDMSDAKFNENFKYADGESYIEARFTAGKLTYLAISKCGTY